MENKRLFIGGLFPGIEESELHERLGKFGTVHNVKIKTRCNEEGKPVKTFAHLDLETTPENVKKCMSLYNGSKWKGFTLSIQLAKESFLDKLQTERTSTKAKGDESAIKGNTMQPKDIKIPGSKIGDAVPGEEQWVIGKYGRALPVVHMRRKGGKKIVKVDPSKYCSGMKLMKDSEIKQTTVDDLTWEIEESDSEITKKKMGEFPSPKVKKKRKSVSPSKPADVQKNVQRNDDDFEVVSFGGKIKPKENFSYCAYNSDSEDSEDMEEALGLKGSNPMCEKVLSDNFSNQPTSKLNSKQSELSETNLSKKVGKGQSGSQSKKKGEQMTSKNKPSIQHMNQANGDNSDSDASTDIEDILSRFTTPQGEKKGEKVVLSQSSDSESVLESDNDGAELKAKLASGDKDLTDVKSVAVSETSDLKLSKKKLKSSRKSVKTAKHSEMDMSDTTCDDENVVSSSTQNSPKKKRDSLGVSNVAWTCPVKKLIVNPNDIVSFDDEGTVIKNDDDGNDSTGSADTDELLSQLSRPKKTGGKSLQIEASPVQRPATSPKKDFQVTAVKDKGKQTGHSKKGFNTSIMDEFASGFDDFVEKSPKQPDSDSSETDSSSSESESENMQMSSRVNAASVTGISVSNLRKTNSKCPENGSHLKMVVSLQQESSESDSSGDEPESEDESSVDSASELNTKLNPLNSVEIESKLVEIEHLECSASDSDSESSSEVAMKDGATATFSDSSDSESSSGSSSVDFASELATRLHPLNSVKITSKLAEIEHSESSSSDSDSESSSEVAMKGGVAAFSDSSDSESSLDSSSSETEDENMKVDITSTKSESPKKLGVKVQEKVESIEKDKTETAKTKEKKKKDKENATKNVTKQEKHKTDNQKRMESFEQRRLESQSQRSAIREALASVDSKKIKNKKVVFSSDSESEDDAKGVVTDPPSKSNEKTLESKVPKGKNAKGLFDSDSEEEDESMDDVDDEDMFRIRPQFEGKAGQKLQRLQRRFGNDERFKMDEKFLELGSEDEDVKPKDVKDDSEKMETSERDKQMNVLKDMFGPKGIRDKPAKKTGFLNTQSIHFDPTREDHSQFEVQSEPKKTEKKAKKKKKKEVQEEEVNEVEPLPEVSKERFYEVTSNLKGMFQESTDAPTFSFLGANAEDQDVDKNNEDASPAKTKATNLLPWQVETFNYDTSSGEEEEEDEKMETEERSALVEKVSAAPSKLDTFFFSIDDPRIKESVENFYRKEDLGCIRREWLKKRPELLESYRMKRKRALRKQRQEKVPNKRGKWKF